MRPNEHGFHIDEHRIDEHRPLFHEEFHAGPRVIFEPEIIRQEPIVEPPIVIQPLIFATVTAANVGKVFAEMQKLGYKLHPSTDGNSGTIEHGSFLTHFKAAYSVTIAGLEVSASSHQDKLTEDFGQAALLAK